MSGGIHLDGMVDTADALYSRRETEKKLEILKDPHVGAFGVIVCGGYLLASFALWGQLHTSPRLLVPCCAGFFLSRCCSAMAVVSFPAAKIPDWRIYFLDMRTKKRCEFAVDVIWRLQAVC